LTNREQLRLDIGDNEKVAVAEKFGSGDGVTKYFRLSMYPISDNSDVITSSGSAQTRDTDYTIDNQLGLITMTSAPASGTVLLAQVYKYYAFSDTELDDVLTEQGGDRNKCAAHCCRVLATNAAKLFAYRSGDEDIDRTKESEHFRAMAESWEKKGESESTSTIDFAVTRLEIYDNEEDSDSFLN